MSRSPSLIYYLCRGSTVQLQYSFLCRLATAPIVSPFTLRLAAQVAISTTSSFPFKQSPLTFPISYELGCEAAKLLRYNQSVYTSWLWDTGYLLPCCESDTRLVPKVLPSREEGFDTCLFVWIPDRPPGASPLVLEAECRLPLLCVLAVVFSWSPFLFRPPFPAMGVSGPQLLALCQVASSSGPTWDAAGIWLVGMACEGGRGAGRMAWPKCFRFRCQTLYRHDMGLGRWVWIGVEGRSGWGGQETRGRQRGGISDVACHMDGISLLCIFIVWGIFTCYHLCAISSWGMVSLRVFLHILFSIFTEGLHGYYICALCA